MAKYVKNKDLYAEILKSKENGEPSEELYMMFWLMCKNIINRPRFSRYTFNWKEDMISTSLLKCIKVYHKFDIKKTNPFSYFTSVISNCFLDTAHAENKQFDIKTKIYDVFLHSINSPINIQGNTVDDLDNN